MGLNGFPVLHVPISFPPPTFSRLSGDILASSLARALELTGIGAAHGSGGMCCPRSDLARGRILQLLADLLVGRAVCGSANLLGGVRI